MERMSEHTGLISSLSLLHVQTQAARWKAATLEQLTGAHLYIDHSLVRLPPSCSGEFMNTQFTDHVAAFRRRCLLIIQCLSISWLHACSVGESTGLATLPGLPLVLTQDYITDVHTRVAGLHLGEVLADNEVERGNGLTIVTEGTQLPVSFWRFH